MDTKYIVFGGLILAGILYILGNKKTTKTLGYNNYSKGELIYMVADELDAQGKKKDWSKLEKMSKRQLKSKLSKLTK